MARWFHALNRKTGDWSWMAGGDEEDFPGGYDRRCWTFTLLEREPGHFDTWDGKAVVLDAAALDAALQAGIDEAAGAFRARFITAIPGQDMTYMRKEIEARAFVAGGAGPFPMLETQVALTGGKIADFAAAIVAKAEEWLVVGAGIEAIRLAAKQAVPMAETEEAKRRAAEIDWPAALAALAVPKQP